MNLFNPVNNAIGAELFFNNLKMKINASSEVWELRLPMVESLWIIKEAMATPLHIRNDELI